MVIYLTILGCSHKDRRTGNLGFLWSGREGQPGVLIPYPVLSGMSRGKKGGQ
jgi:hypothetical protein